MTALQTERLAFGAGLDRASGLVRVAPEAFTDLRNVELGEGRAWPRPGITLTSGLSLGGLGITPMSDVVAILTYRTKAMGLVVGYEQASRKLQLFAVGLVGTNPVYVGDLGAVDAAAQRPTVWATERYGKVLFAHNEPDASKRLATMVYDGTALTTLTADLDTAGAAPVAFRGVATWLGYALGWGYGSASQPERGEVIRVSLPAQVTTFVNTDYFRAGEQAESVLAVVTAGPLALAFKQTAIYRLLGSGRDDFGIWPVDPHYGLAGTRLAVAGPDAVYFWSLRGPRRTDGGLSVDLALPLDLTGPDPAGLAAAADPEDGFAVYHTDLRRVEFHFGQRCYVLHLRDPQRPRWSYRENGVALRTAGTLYYGTAAQGGGGAPAAPTGFPVAGTFTATTSTVTAPYTYTGALGDEVLEVWLKVGAGSWAQKINRTVANTTGETFGFTAADGLSPGVLVTVAARLRRGLLYTAGYESSDPGSWPASARSSVTTASGAGTPSNVHLVGGATEVVGSKTYDSFRFTWTAGSPGTQTQLLASTTSDPAAAGVLLTVAIGTTDSGNVGSYLQQATPSNRWFFVRHLMADGTPGTAVACAENPVNVSQAWGP